ncbi:MAG: peptidoglycan editing factor PgeF [Anaerolineaceae bacterium]|nr:peptidoglycan editing factor PgeF [Anaerolineaceae bacterium]MBN2676734.1 peptidoglycan editing factor PgeF [Anaerolineaceae bacterium]
MLIDRDSLRYFCFDSLMDAGVVQAIYSRHGGVSKVPFAALNTGGTVGDDPRAVAENRRRIFTSLDRPLSSIFDVWQVHSVNVAIATAPRPVDQPHQQADIILTNKPGVTLFMRFADCVPVFLVDSKRKVIGLVHAGWIGTLNHAVSIGLKAMQDQFGSKPGDILAGIGPSIGVCHYCVGDDVAARVEKAFPEVSTEILVKREDGIHFDLWKANQFELEAGGVRQIEIAGLCTACNITDWYSHRAESGKTGRFGALIALSG